MTVTESNPYALLIADIIILFYKRLSFVCFALTFNPDVGAKETLKLSTVLLTDFSLPFFHRLAFALPT